jgi:hypothetical protein
MLYLSLLILFFYLAVPYPIHVPNDRYMRNDETEGKKMLRLLGILTLGNMIFGGHRHHYHRRLSRRLGRGILLGTLLGLFVSRANQNRTEEC